VGKDEPAVGRLGAGETEGEGTTPPVTGVEGLGVVLRGVGVGEGVGAVGVGVGEGVGEGEGEGVGVGSGPPKG